jgi:hypothetical protein
VAAGRAAQELGGERLEDATAALHHGVDVGPAGARDLAGRGAKTGPRAVEEGGHERL